MKEVAKMRIAKVYFAGVMLITIVGGAPAFGASVSEDAAITGLKFSSEEVDLIKKLNLVQLGGNLGATMFKATPIAQLVTSLNPTEMLITVATGDWDSIFGALGKLRGITACEIVMNIDLWEVTEKYSSDKTRQFFDRIKRNADSKCPS